MSLEVARRCERETIRFILLLPNARHVCPDSLPLEVTFFHPMKILWNKIFIEYKEEHHGSKKLKKSKIPRLLKKLLDSISINTAQNIHLGFRKCGAIPLNRSEVIQTIQDGVTLGQPTFTNNSK